MSTTMLSQEFKSHDKLKAIGLAEANSTTRGQRKSITVQHFNDSGQPDSPAEVVLCEAGHSPVAIESINGGYYLAKENDPDNISQDQGSWKGQQREPQAQYQR